MLGRAAARAIETKVLADEMEDNLLVALPHHPGRASHAIRGGVLHSRSARLTPDHPYLADARRTRQTGAQLARAITRALVGCR